MLSKNTNSMAAAFRFTRRSTKKLAQAHPEIPAPPKPVESSNGVRKARLRLSQEGWTVREHLNDRRFRSAELVGREVVFQMEDEEGTLEEFRGVYESTGVSISAFFRLEGREEYFNGNLATVFAVGPNVRESEAPSTEAALAHSS